MRYNPATDATHATIRVKPMQSRKIANMLEKAAYFRMLADPDENHRIANTRGGQTTMTPERAAQRAQFWDDRAALLYQEGLEKRRAKKA